MKCIKIIFELKVLSNLLQKLICAKNYLIFVIPIPNCKKSERHDS